MKVQCIDHVGINVRDLPAAKAFFVSLGFELLGEAEMEGEWLDLIVGLNGVKTAIAMLGAPNGGTNIELVTFFSPEDEQPPQQLSANALGIRHIALVVDDIDAMVARLQRSGTETFSPVQRYEDSYKLCYIRGPEGMILELAQEHH